MDADAKSLQDTKQTNDLADLSYEAGTREDSGLFAAGGNGAPGFGEEPSSTPLPGDVAFEGTVGEGRRVLALFVAREIAPHLFKVTAESMRVIGGHNLLRERASIPGLFASLDAAWAAGSAWATDFNEIAD